jgi:uncharacterized protein with PIN domain
VTPKEARELEEKLEPCRKCGGKLFLSGYTIEASDGLEHIIIRCKKCGYWYGGITRKKKTRKD